MSDILDLDALVPRSRSVKIKDRVFTCLPLTLGQLITLERLTTELATVQSLSEVAEKVTQAFDPFLPELKGDSSIFQDLRVDQLQALIRFAQSGSIPESMKSTKSETPSEKKTNSPEQ